MRPWSATQVPQTRTDLLAGWNGPLWQEVARRQHTGPFAKEIPSHRWEEVYEADLRQEMSMLGEAELWWVGKDMCELLFATIPAIPDDVRQSDLTLPSDDGLVVFETPWAGALDAETGTATMTVDAVAWGKGNLLQPPLTFGPSPQVCLSVSSYRYIEFGDGLGAGWAPLGRSDWPDFLELNEVVPRPGPHDRDWFDESTIEDRRLIAALSTLVATKTISELETVSQSRQVIRAAERKGRPVPRDVNVVYLRRHSAPAGEPTGEHRGYSHRFPVSAHPRMQACGPDWSERKLIMVPAYIKGDPSLPLVKKPVVRAWVK